MAYLRCTKCGAKALSAASQCPRCSHLFDVYDARGMRVKLAYCRGCGFMHRGDAACPTCGVLPARFSWSMPTRRQLTSAASLAAVVAGAWAWGNSADDASGRARTVATPVNATSAASVAPPRTSGPGTAMAAASDVEDQRAQAPSPAAVAAAPDTVEPAAIPVADETGAWVPVVARTWVNVRSDASREGLVVGVIKPSSRALLGTNRGGWRLVKSPEYSGWVDPRLFEPDSLQSRGD